MRLRHLSLLLLFLTNVAGAQSSPPDSVALENLNKSANKMGQLFVKKDYTSYVKFVHPKLLQMVGGPDKLIALLKKSLKETEEKGISFRDVSIGRPSKIVKTSSGFQTVIPQKLILNTDKGMLQATSYLIATSSDKGKTWYFLDIGGKTIEQMKAALPFLSEELVIPERQPPVLLQQ